MSQLKYLLYDHFKLKSNSVRALRGDFLVSVDQEIKKREMSRKRKEELLQSLFPTKKVI